MAPSSLHGEFLGKPIRALPTPALIVDRPTLLDNLAEMQQLVSTHSKALRPHIKTHKCSAVARLQIDSGAVGVTCATVGEAEAMAAAGIGDILIANQLVTADKLERVVRMLSSSHVKFVVDSLFGIEQAETVARREGLVFSVLVEVDIGGHRCGTQTPQETVVLVKRIHRSKALQFEGIQAYYGGTSYIKDLQERQLKVSDSERILAESLNAVRQVYDIPRVSGAGTGNAGLHLQGELLTEIQAGSYVYSDTTYRGLSPAYRPALFVLGTVLSRPTASRIVIDVGLKAMGTEFSVPELVGYPHLGDYHFSEEHLQIQVHKAPFPKIGEKVLIIPSHCCTTVNLHRRCFVVQDDQIVDVWAIDAF